MTEIAKQIKNSVKETTQELKDYFGKNMQIKEIPSVILNFLNENKKIIAISVAVYLIFQYLFKEEEYRNEDEYYDEY